MGIVRSVMKVFLEVYALFVPFIISPSFTMLNLFIAIIVDPILTPYHHGATPQSTMSLKRCMTTAAHYRQKFLSARRIHDLRGTFEYNRVY